MQPHVATKGFVMVLRGVCILETREHRNTGAGECLVALQLLLIFRAIRAGSHSQYHCPVLHPYFLMPVAMQDQWMSTS